MVSRPGAEIDREREPRAGGNDGAKDAREGGFHGQNDGTGAGDVGGGGGVAPGQKADVGEDKALGLGPGDPRRDLGDAVQMLGDAVQMLQHAGADASRLGSTTADIEPGVILLFHDEGINAPNLA